MKKKCHPDFFNGFAHQMVYKWRKDVSELLGVRAFWDNSHIGNALWYTQMGKAPPFTESSCWAIFLLKSLPMCINMWVKVKKMMLITALCVYGPLSKLVDLAQFGSFWSQFLHFFSPIRVWMAPNLVQWDKVLLYCSGGGLWGPFWDILECF